MQQATPQAAGSIADLVPPWPPRPSPATEQRVLEVLRSGLWGSTQGSVVEAVNRRLAAVHGVPSAVCCANGTIAIALALKAAGVGPGDEVIVPAYTFLATASAPALIGAIPVFAEIDPQTMLLDAGDASRRISKRTKAVVPVHIAGAMAEAAAMRRALEGSGVVVIEDAAQAIGAEHVEGKVGQLGDFATLSFQTSKNVAAGEGGAVLCRDEPRGRLVWSLHNAGRERGGGWYQHDHFGWNLRMPEIQGVIVDAMLDELDVFQTAREAGHRRLAAMAKAEGLPLAPVESARTIRHGRHLMIWRLDTARGKPEQRARIVESLQAIGVHASAGYPPINRMPAVRRGVVALGGAEPAALPITEEAAQSTFWLPQPVLLAPEEAHRAVVDAMMRALG